LNHFFPCFSSPLQSDSEWNQWTLANWQTTNFLRNCNHSKTWREKYLLMLACAINIPLPFSIKSEGLSLFLGFQKRGNFWRNPACSVFLWVWITSELNLFSECWSRSAGCRFEPKLQWLRDPCNQFHEQDVRNSTVHIGSWIQIDFISTDFFNATCKTKHSCAAYFAGSSAETFLIRNLPI